MVLVLRPGKVDENDDEGTINDDERTMTFNYGKRGRNRNIFVDFEILVFFRNEYLDSENWRKNENNENGNSTLYTKLPPLGG